MINSISEFEWVSIWNSDNEELKEQLPLFWTNKGLMSKGEAKRRVNEAVLVITIKGEIVGVSTVFPTYFNKLKAYVYAYRCFIDKPYRAPALDTCLTIKTKKILELDTPETHKPVGLLTVVQNEEIKKYWDKAVWKGTNLVYIGNADNGDHLRISYFDNAKI